MPVLESTDNMSPRSALRHRPLDTSATKQGVTAEQPVVQRASRVQPKIADDELVSEWQRGDARKGANASATGNIINPPVPQRHNPAKKRIRTTSYHPAQRLTPFHCHPLLLLGLGMLLMLVLWTLLTAGVNWWNNSMNYLHYGYPRTFQTDAVVGHSDSANNPSHFLALNLHGRIEIVELPGGDGSHARIYLGPQLFDANADTIPVTLRFADVNGDHRPDMLVFFASSWMVFINTQSSFRAPTAQEHQDAAGYLATHSP